VEVKKREELAGLAACAAKPTGCATRCTFLWNGPGPAFSDVSCSVSESLPSRSQLAAHRSEAICRADWLLPDISLRNLWAPRRVRWSQALQSGVSSALNKNGSGSWRAGCTKTCKSRFGGEGLVFLSNQDLAFYPTLFVRRAPMGGSCSPACAFAACPRIRRAQA